MGTRPAAQRRGGVASVTISNLAVGASAALLLGGAPRLLGHVSFVGLSLAWTVTTVFGYGLAMPTEQLLSRRLNARDARGASSPTLWLGLMAAACAVAVILLGSKSEAARTDPYLTASAVVGILGWALVASVRGRVAGGGDLHAYAWLLGVEAAARILLVAVAAAHRPWAAWLLAASIGGPILVAGLAGVQAASRKPTSTVGPGGAKSPSPPQPSGRAEPLAFIFVALGYQVCLNSPALVLEARVGAAAATSVGAFVVASSYFRLASVLAAGYATHALASLSHAWGIRDFDGFHRLLRKALVGATTMSALTTAVAAAVSPLALPLFYGRDPHLGRMVLASLAISTVIATVAAVSATALMAVGHGASAAAWWLFGGIVLTLVIAFDQDLGALTAIGLTAGPAVALCGLLITTARFSAQWQNEIAKTGAGARR